MNAIAQLPDVPARILLVDDEGYNLKLLEIMLGPEGYDLQSASSGQQALDVVARDQPDLILLDVMMPGLDGYVVAQRLKGAWRPARSPSSWSPPWIAAPPASAASRRAPKTSFTDINMPEMGGPALARHVRSLQPSAKLLFMSGHAGVPLQPPSGVIEAIPLVQKPFSPAVLAAKVREVLDATPPILDSPPPTLDSPPPVLTA